jgi:hypothetical protein
MRDHELTPHPEQQRTYAALRAEFRVAALAALRIQYAGHHPVGWNMTGDPAAARDRFDAAGWRDQMLLRLDDPVSQDFGLSSVPAAAWERLDAVAQRALLHDSVTWDEGEDQDAPACGDVSAMSDDNLCDYVDRSIRESARG